MYINFVQFARYLAQEMGVSDQFGDDEDDDEGWLTQSTFGLTNPPLTRRTVMERKPLGDGFDVSVPIIS